MTEEEVELIYNYLHENYRYEDGELITKKRLGNKKEGEKAGSFFIGARGKPILKIEVKVNNKRYKLYLSSAIYLFYHKIYSPYISFLDSNCTNLRIENLNISSKEKMKLEVYSKCAGTKRAGDKFKAIITRDKKEIYLGLYSSQNAAHEVYVYATKIISDNPFISALEIKSYIKEKFSNSTLRLINKCSRGVKDRGNKFEAYIYIRINGKYKQKVIGYFKSDEEAHAAYLKAKEEYAQKT